MIDTHCHLDFDHFDGQRDDLVRQAQAAGVHTIVDIGTDLDSSARAVALADRFDSVYAAVGIHPHDAKKLDKSSLDRLRDLAAHPKVVAIGEIGLDFYRDLSPRKVQHRAFEQQLELASQLKLPVVIHTREAFEDTLEVVKTFAGRISSGVFHCFPGDLKEAEAVFELGYLVAVGGIVTYKNSQMSRLAAQVPLDKLVLETDAPYLTPVPYRGKTNCPAYVEHVGRKVAELRQCELAEVEKITDRNARKLFRLVETFGG